MDSLDKIIDLRWDDNADNLATTQDTVQNYYYIGEPLIQIANLDSVELLPALFFTLRNDTLVDFRCSILYSPRNRGQETIHHLLDALTPYFDKLTTSNYKQLCENLVLQFDNAIAQERFSIDTSQIDQIRFDYEIKAR